MEYGELVLAAESLILLSAMYVQCGVLEESRAMDYRQVLGFYIYSCTPEESTPDFIHAVDTIASHLKGLN